MISTLLPTLAGIALVANALGWLGHRQWHRSVPGMIGPVLVFAGLWLLFGRWWNAVLYAGLAGAGTWPTLSIETQRL